MKLKFVLTILFFQFSNNIFSLEAGDTKSPDDLKDVETARVNTQDNDEQSENDSRVRRCCRATCSVEKITKSISYRFFAVGFAFLFTWLILKGDLSLTGQLVSANAASATVGYYIYELFWKRCCHKRFKQRSD